jgi:superfamily II DNA or RNA helicase
MERHCALAVIARREQSVSAQSTGNAFKPAPFIGRRWQLEALRKLDKLRRKGQQDFLLVVAPAAGKTRFGLEAARAFLSEREVLRVVVVCHSDHLRKQWAQAAAKVGIALDPNWSNADGVEADTYHGVVVTYQQIAFAPDLFRMNCTQRTLVILDEVHHVADRKTWGAAVQQAFEVARFRLGMSGTLFRADGRKIPFVRYEQGCSKPDFIYGYAEAIVDNVCRPIYFQTYEGEVVWLREGSEELYEYSLLDVVDRATAAERLQAALDPARQWLRHVITEADAHLTAIRESGHNDAGGLVVATDQLHAKRIAKLVEEISHETPVVAISEDPDASKRIDDYARGIRRWIVSVRMVSEGVDIPRLRVGVFATNVRTEMFFRQVCGRLVRYTQGLREQSAVMYLPADETLMRYALAIKEEREYSISPDTEEDDVQTAEEGVDCEEWGDHLVKSLSAEPKPYDAIFDGSSFVQPELTFAARACREMGITSPFPHVAALIRLGAAQAGVYVRRDAVPIVAPARLSPTASDTFSSQTYLGKSKSLRDQTNAVAQNLALLLEISATRIHEEWITIGGMPADIATPEDLKRKLEWLKHRFADEREAKGYRVGSGFYSLDALKRKIDETSRQ